jgi:hypothetical protein
MYPSKPPGDIHQHSQLWGENRECMRNEFWKVHSFVLARREAPFANVGIDAAFRYIDELIFAIVHVCPGLVPWLGQVIRHAEGAVRLFAVCHKGHHVPHIPAGVIKVSSLREGRQSD